MSDFGRAGFKSPKIKSRPNISLGKGLKSWKHDFEITGDPKGPTFWSGFEGPDS